MATLLAAHRPRPRSASARPILAEVVDQIADVQVRNRGTIGGNVCSNDPTNHLPPLLVALGATMTIVGARRRAHGARGGVLPRRLHDRGRPGRAADDGSRSRPGGAATASPSVPIGTDGTCIVNAAASLDGGAPRVALGCVDAVAGASLAARRRTDEDARARGRARGAALDPPSRRARLGRLPPPPRRGPRRRAPSRRPSGEELTWRPSPSKRRSRSTVNGETLRARGRGAPAARPLPPRRPRPDRHARRLRHGQLRRLHGARRRRRS